MFNALLNDFIVRRNLRIAQQKHSRTPFVVSSCGSHHLALVNSITLTHNKLKQLGPNIQLKLDVLPILPDVPSGEVFGLMKSDYLATFNGLIEVKEEVPDADLVPDDLQSTCMNSLDFANSEAADLALRASRAVLFDEWQIDPVMLEQPQSSSTTTLLIGSTTGMAQRVTRPDLGCNVQSTLSVEQPTSTSTMIVTESALTIGGCHDEALSLRTDLPLCPSKQPECLRLRKHMLREWLQPW